MELKQTSIEKLAAKNKYNTAMVDFELEITQMLRHSIVKYSVVIIIKFKHDS